MSLFINVTHHSASKWSNEQIETAKIHPVTGTSLEIIDLQFPSVKSTFDKIDISKIASRYTNKVLDIVKNITGENYNMDYSIVVHVMGEQSLSYALIKILKEYKFLVVVSCTDRVLESNGVNKKAKFKFVRFREI